MALRLQAHGVALQRVERAAGVAAEAHRIEHFAKRPRPFEGRHLHDELQVRVEPLLADVAAGDWLILLGGAHDRFIVETLEPLGIDSFFRWAFFDSVLDKKEHFSDYLFEDEAEQLLAEEPGLRERFEAWKAAHPEQLGDADAVLGFIFHAAQRHAEPAWRRHPVLRLLELPA